MKSGSTALLRARSLFTVRNGVIGVFGVLVFIAGIGIGMRSPQPIPANQFTSVRAPDSQYTLIDPVLYMTVPESAAFPAFSPLKDALTKYVNSSIAKGNATQVSVYYRDLNSNRWVGVNPESTFWPASMLKVTVLMSVLRDSEASPQILDHEVLVRSSDVTDLQQDFYPPANPVTSGNTYSVNTLLDRMIMQSDNNANNALISYLGSAELHKTFSDLHVPFPDTATGTGITAQQYSHLFRVLYNATYLSPADSNRALELLTKTTFTQGLVAGVPTGTVVAHKFGETTTSTSETDTGKGAPNVRELHDCGIVYYPDHPYFICIMTRGSDYATLANVIQDMSKTTWQQVDALNKGTKADPQSGFL
ncbi:MAG: beta-lactamase class A-like protein beta-lactamase [Parcubacteria group bacterium]|nr:beta-lactamase class A-like protein beta-lactamase [Parcubacteria group bacterium]